jgi:hypothetical protein
MRTGTGQAKLETGRRRYLLCKNKRPAPSIISAAMPMTPPPNRQPPNQGVIILLYIAGVALVITAIIIVLRGTGVLKQIPEYAIWAIVLFTIGAGILGGIRSTRRW